MAEFEEHFDKGKVELVSCERPYGTPCRHEHACLLNIRDQGLADFYLDRQQMTRWNLSGRSHAAVMPRCAR
jgi:hypothetical protein